MLTMHPTLLTGPADWDAACLPRDEFSARIAALWTVCEPDVAGALVFGSPHDHAALAWLTNFTPKLEAGLALIGRDGAVRLLIGGGVNMLEAARSLTLVATLAPLRGAIRAITEWRNTLGEGARLVLIGGEAMPSALHHEIAAALGRGSEDGTDITAMPVPLMRRKSARELAAIHQSSRILEAAVAALGSAWRSGADATAALLAAEEGARRVGAQDVRTLLSLDGGRTLAPFTDLDLRRIDPLQVYVAVRRHGYWAEGFAMFASAPNAAARAAGATLRGAIAMAAPGVGRRTLAEALAGQVLHPVVGGSPVADIGLALAPEEPTDPDEKLAPASVYSLRAGSLAGGEGAILSAMIAVTAIGAEVLWMAPS